MRKAGRGEVTSALRWSGRALARCAGAGLGDGVGLVAAGTPTSTSSAAGVTRAGVALPGAGDGAMRATGSTTGGAAARGLATCVVDVVAADAVTSPSWENPSSTRLAAIATAPAR